MLKLNLHNNIYFAGSQKNSNKKKVADKQISGQLAFTDDPKTGELSIVENIKKPKILTPDEELKIKIDQHLDTDGNFLIKRMVSPEELKQIEYLNRKTYKSLEEMKTLAKLQNNLKTQTEKRNKSLTKLDQRVDETAERWLVRILDRAEPNDYEYKRQVVDILSKKIIPRNRINFYKRPTRVLYGLIRNFENDGNRLPEILSNPEEKRVWAFDKMLDFMSIRSFILNNDYQSVTKFNKGLIKHFDEYLKVLQAATDKTGTIPVASVEENLKLFLKRGRFTLL